MDPGYLDINLKQIVDNAKLLNLDIEQWSTTITGVGASKTVKIDKKVKNTGLDILLSVTISGTTVTVNVLNANGGTLKFKVRNKVTI